MFGDMRSTRAGRTTALLTVASLVAAVPAVATTTHGVTPVSPKAGASVTAARSATFSGRVSGRGSVWVHVSTSRKRDKSGVIGHQQMIQQAKRTGRRFRTTTRFYDFPSFWLNKPGTYYWQAYRVFCPPHSTDCVQEGPVTKFKVG